MRAAVGNWTWAALVVGACLLRAGGAFAAMQTLAPSDDTFINQGNPGNNNGASVTFFTGTDGHGGVMRGLVRFGMPAGLQGRVTVTGVQLTMTLDGLGPNSMTPGAPAVVSLQALTQAWAEGNGIGDTTTTFTVGQPCGGTISGVTWNQPNCALAGAWTTAGGTVVAAVSGQADTTGIPVGGTVGWGSGANPGLIQDVQGWIDNPASNDGWRLASSTEGSSGLAQRYFSKEAGATAPTLIVSYDCKPGFVASGVSCLPVAAAVPATGPRALAALALALALLAAAFMAPPAWRRRQRPRSARPA
jgi:hypothetical protein